MIKIIHTLFIFLFLLSSTGFVQSQTAGSGDWRVGIRLQKTEKLYWENGLTVDYSSNFLLDKQVHLKLNYVSSRLGSAIGSNAIRQDNYLLGADWHFCSKKSFQVFAGCNTGFFHADIEEPMFDVLPHNSMLFSLEAGLFYQLRCPVSASLSAGYNLINGDGTNNVPGTLFPVFYQLSVYYSISSKK